MSEIRLNLWCLRWESNAWRHINRSTPPLPYNEKNHIIKWNAPRDNLLVGCPPLFFSSAFPKRVFSLPRSHTHEWMKSRPRSVEGRTTRWDWDTTYCDERKCFCQLTPIEMFMFIPAFRSETQNLALQISGNKCISQSPQRRRFSKGSTGSWRVLC